MPSLDDENLLALRRPILSSPRLSQRPSFNNDLQATLSQHPSFNTDLQATVSTTSKQKRKGTSWFFHVIYAFANCFKPSFKAEPKGINFALQDISARSSISRLSQSSRSSSPSQYVPSGETSRSVAFTMAEIIRATNNFSPSLQIGEGGSGTVYKGTLPDGRLVAIKRAKKHGYETQLSAEFHSELATLSKIEHLNLVKFLGYLDASPERILVVEYVSNGNLRQHLDGKFGRILDLSTRLDIAIDVAHALTYLHHYADRTIIHRDIKASNVLLTNSFRAKVADFGFSRTGPWELNATHVSTQIRGTAGYLDPEYLRTYQLTQKSDVYSFGVLLVEIFTGRSPIQPQKESTERITTKWAFRKLQEGRVIETLDPKLERSPAADMMVEKALEVAMQCAAPAKHQRPSMNKTVEQLWSIRKDYQNLWRNWSHQHSAASLTAASPSPRNFPL